MDEDLKALKDSGENIDQYLVPGVLDQEGKPSFTSELKKSAQNLGNKVMNQPIETAAAFGQGIRNSFEPPSEIFGYKTGVPERVFDKLEGTLAFPFIRGAELADRMFGENKNEKQFKSWRQTMEDRILLSKTLEERNPELVQGAEIGSFMASLPALGKAGIKILAKAKNVPEIVVKIPNLYKKLLNFRAARLEKKAADLAEDITKVGKGPVQDAMVKRPEEVKDLVDNDPETINDLAQEIRKKIEKGGQYLGEQVGKFRKDFIADPTKRVNVVDSYEAIDPATGQPMMMESPKAILDEFKQITTSTQGKSALSSKQQSNLKYVEDLLELNGDTKDIAPKDAMLAIDRLQNMINYDKKVEGALNAAEKFALIKTRRSLKYQIRGPDVNWFKADERYSNYLEKLEPFESGLNELKTEGLVSNLFGANKTEFRKQMTELIDLVDEADVNMGNGEAFFNRLANIKAAQNIKNTQMQVNRVLQEHMHDKVRRYATRGAAAGAITGYLKLGGTDTAMIGSAIGGAAGIKVGQVMANPMRILNAAKKSKEVSAKAKTLADDLTFVHKNFGPDGVISFLDVIGSVPAANELAEFSNRLGPEKPKSEEKKGKYYFPKESELSSLRYVKQEEK